MNPTDNLTKAEQVTVELNKVLKLFDIKKNNAEVTTSSGRTYIVANVTKNDDNWVVTDFVSRGMFCCDVCDRDFPADFTRQITHNDDVIRLHVKEIHVFREHPDKVPAEKVEEVAKVLLG